VSPTTTVPFRSPNPPSSGATQTGRGFPSASHASLSGVGKGRPKLRFTLTSGTKAAKLRAITIALPRGMGFSSSKKNLARGILVKAGSRTQKFTAKVSRGKLLITLNTPASTAQVTISSPAITVSTALAKKVQSRKVKTLSVLLTVTTTRHTTTPITLKLRVT
jgi:hypothetical protein